MFRVVVFCFWRAELPTIFKIVERQGEVSKLILWIGCSARVRSQMCQAARSFCLSDL